MKMFLKVFWVVFVLSQCRCENEESDLQYELLSMEEYDRDFSPIFDYPESEDDNFVELKEPSDDANSKESPAEEGVSFAGPVKAKGTVSMTATFGTAPSPNYPQLSTMNPFWFPTPYPQYFLPPIPYISPMPLPFTHMPLQPIFTPGTSFPFPDGNLKNSRKESKKNSEKSNKKEFKIANEESSLKASTEKELTTKNDENSPEIQPERELKTAKNEFFLKLTPLISTEVPVSSELTDTKSCDEILSSSIAFADEDFTDYEEINDESNTPVNDEKSKGSESSNGVTFAGFVPACGSVHITARF